MRNRIAHHLRFPAYFSPFFHSDIWCARSFGLALDSAEFAEGTATGDEAAPNLGLAGDAAIAAGEKSNDLPATAAMAVLGEDAIAEIHTARDAVSGCRD